MSSPQFTLYSHAGGPNGWTVAFLLAALDLSYDTKYLQFDKGEHKADDFLKLNPNGRIPALVDHQNGDFVVWESKACLMYLAEKYDKSGEWTVQTAEERATLAQWLFFQASGQGPYFGQAAHFAIFAPEKIQYGINRYQNEVKRVLSVLELALNRSGAKFLTGDKVSLADISFITWSHFALHGPLLPEGTDAKSEFPKTVAWHNSLLELPYVKKVLAEKEEVGKK